MADHDDTSSTSDAGNDDVIDVDSDATEDPNSDSVSSTDLRFITRGGNGVVPRLQVGWLAVAVLRCVVCVMFTLWLDDRLVGWLRLTLPLNERTFAL